MPWDWLGVVVLFVLWVGTVLVPAIIGWIGLSWLGLVKGPIAVVRNLLLIKKIRDWYRGRDD